MTMQASHAIDLETAAAPRAAARGTVSLSSALLTPAMFAVIGRTIECTGLVALGASITIMSAPSQDVSSDTSFLLAPILTVLVATTIFHALGLYTTSVFNAPAKHAVRLVLGWTLSIVVIAVAARVTKFAPAFDGNWMAIWFAAGLACIATIRFVLKRATQAARQAGYLTRNAIIYGSGGSSEALIAQLRNDPNSDVRICGVFDDRTDQRSAASIADIPCLGDIEALKGFARSGNVDMLIMSLPLAAETRVTLLMQRLSELPIDVRLAATASTLRFHKSAYSYIGAVPVIDLCERPISGWNACAKWLFDKVIGLLALVLLAPVMAIVALAVKLESKGPVIFKQKRYGFNNELIEVYKFRSMFTDRTDATASKLVTRNDPRVTGVGRIIRKTSLDELPQIFNVLRGTLSLVGPRPHAVQAKAADRVYPDVVDGYFARHKVKPGITGWAQINGWRGETDTAEKICKRVEFDLEYIDNWSVWLDLYILVKTPVALVNSDNAY